MGSNFLWNLLFRSFHWEPVELWWFLLSRAWCRQPAYQGGRAAAWSFCSCPAPWWRCRWSRCPGGRSERPPPPERRRSRSWPRPGWTTGLPPWTTSNQSINSADSKKIGFPIDIFLQINSSRKTLINSQLYWLLLWRKRWLFSFLFSLNAHLNLWMRRLSFIFR